MSKKIWKAIEISILNQIYACKGASCIIQI